MSDPLASYLHDHLAGAELAIELLQTLRTTSKEERLRTFIAELLPEVESDRNTLQTITEQAGSGSNTFKELTAWLAEKAAHLKLRAGGTTPFETFETLEFLTMGVSGKLHLWRALQNIAGSEPRLMSGVDYRQLIQRAETQHAGLEEQRLIFAAKAMNPG